MLQHSELDRIFQALSDPTRRAMLERLTNGPASVSELRAPFSMTLSAIGQHLALLEECGLVHSRKRGRVRTVELEPRVLAQAERWFVSHRRRWERRLDRLGAQLAEPDEAEHATPPPQDQRSKK